MFLKNVTILLLAFFLAKNGEAQTACGTLGQNPSTAFPVCGTSVFNQDSVPVCGGRVVPCQCPSPPPPYFPFTDKNPFWYKFTCFNSGTLGFIITPKNLGEDYDWQLFDVTNHNPDEVFDSVSLFVACNWSAEYGITGASPLGNSTVECDGAGIPLFSSMPALVAGHNYLLLISHFSDSQSGYALSFGGGTAVITDPVDPHLLNARAACDGTSAMVRLNKRIQCRTLSPDGSEFTINPPLANIIAASGSGCSNGFDMDSVMLTLDSPLPPGNYTIIIKNGTDGNTLKDNCDIAIPPGENIPMTVYPFIPTPMDSISKPGCAPDILQLVFKKRIKCSSIAADGSDFTVTGSYPVAVISAYGTCNGNLSSVINIRLQAPLQRNGNFSVTLVTGTDGNTIIDECSQETPPGAVLAFPVADTVNADFGYAIRYGCSLDTVDYVHDGRNGVNYWKWNFDGVSGSNLQRPLKIYNTFGQKQTRLIVSNGVCSDTSAFVPVLLGNELNAAFEATSQVCPGDPAYFKDTSTGNIISWIWNFGNGKTSNLRFPPTQSYQPSRFNTEVPVKLLVMNDLGCLDSAVQKIKVAGNCTIAVPGAFTPNRDGLNDYLYPLNAYKATGLQFRVFNRFGQLVFETRDWTKRWDGTCNGQAADPGTYVWTLHYTNAYTGKYVEQRGTSILIR